MRWFAQYPTVLADVTVCVTVQLNLMMLLGPAWPDLVPVLPEMVFAGQCVVKPGCVSAHS